MKDDFDHNLPEEPHAPAKDETGALAKPPVNPIMAEAGHAPKYAKEDKDGTRGNQEMVLGMKVPDDKPLPSLKSEDWDAKVRDATIRTNQSSPILPTPPYVPQQTPPFIHVPTCWPTDAMPPPPSSQAVTDAIEEAELQAKADAAHHEHIQDRLQVQERDWPGKYRKTDEYVQPSVHMPPPSAFDEDGNLKASAEEHKKIEERLGEGEGGGGLRLNAGKIRMELLPPEWIWALADVMTQGAKKYDARNWELGMGWGSLIGCIFRHTLKFMAGERYDGTGYDKKAGTTGCHHMAMAAWNCLALMTYDLRKIGKNDLADEVTMDLLMAVNAATAKIEDGMAGTSLRQALYPHIDTSNGDEL